MSIKDQGMGRKGLLLAGTIIGKSKRFISDNNIEIVTYCISDGDNTY